MFSKIQEQVEHSFINLNNKDATPEQKQVYSSNQKDDVTDISKHLHMTALNFSRKD